MPDNIPAAPSGWRGEAARSNRSDNATCAASVVRPPKWPPHDSESTPSPDVLINQIGSGTVILMSDVDLLAIGASPGGTITNQNDEFLGNLFAYVGGFAKPPAAATSVPTLTPAALTLLALVLVFAFAIARRSQSKAG